jgi:hypothetical protein
VWISCCLATTDPHGPRRERNPLLSMQRGRLSGPLNAGLCGPLGPSPPSGPRWRLSGRCERCPSDHGHREGVTAIRAGAESGPGVVFRGAARAPIRPLQPYEPPHAHVGALLLFVESLHGGMMRVGAAKTYGPAVGRSTTATSTYGRGQAGASLPPWPRPSTRTPFRSPFPGGCSSG